MKNTLLFLLLFSTSFLTAQDAALVKKAETLLELSGAKAQFETALDGLISNYRQNPAFQEGLPEGFWDEFAKEATTNGFDDLQQGLVKLYLASYTEEELDHQIAYYESPITKGIVKKQAQLTQESMAIGAEWGRAMGEQIAKRIMEAKGEKN